MTNQKLTVGYIPKGYPRVSETFVSNEILELEKLGLDIHIFSLMKPEDHHVPQPSAQQVSAPVHYIPSRTVLSLPLLIPVHLVLALRRPRAYWKALRWSVVRCVRRRSLSTIRRFLQAGFIVGWVLRGRTIPHFHSHFCHGPATVGVLVKWLTGATFSFTAHAKDLWLTPQDSLREKMQETEFVLTCTEFNRQYLEETGGDLTPVHLVYHGIDTSRFSPENRRQVLPLRAYSEAGRIPTLLSVGRLVEKKGHDTLIRACGVLRDRGHRFRCVIYGTGPLRSELEALIESLSLKEYVELPGRILQDELVEIYKQADVFALACQILENGDRDGLPNVIVEAQAMGVPVVSTNISGVPELVEHGINGFLVPPRDPQALAEYVGKLFEEQETRIRFSEVGRNKVLREYDMKRNTRRVLALFQEVMGLRPVQLDEGDPTQSSGIAPREGSV